MVSFLIGMIALPAFAINTGVPTPSNGTFNVPPNVNPGDMIGNIINLIFTVMIFAAFIIIAWAGYDIVMSQGSSEAVKKARETISWTIVGILVTIFSYAIMNIVLKSLQII